MRLLLAIVATLTHLAGPGLCCCAPTRVAVAVGSITQVEDDCCCPDCHKEHPPTPPGRSEPVPCDCPDHCPCEWVRLEVAPPPKPDQHPTADGLLVTVAVEPTFTLELMVDVVVSPANLRELPLLTTSDRLFAHHVLRC
jgi:hypothetical protein